MELDWLWQNLVSEWLAAGLALFGGAMLAYLRATSSRWLSPDLYGLAGAALVAVIVFFSGAFIVLSQ
jgi:hypothetical protein